MKFISAAQFLKCIITMSVNKDIIIIFNYSINNLLYFYNIYKLLTKTIIVFIQYFSAKIYLK